MEKIKKITKLTIWDFDGTLISTPLPEFGKPEYKKKTGQDWPTVGWWGQALSLDMNLFEMKTVPMVITEYENVRTCEETCRVMLTGRIIKLGDHVKEILDSHNLQFDEYHYNTGGATEVVKIKTMQKLLEKYKYVKELHLWDDRESHFEIFNKFGQSLIDSGRLEYFELHEVPTKRH